MTPPTAVSERLTIATCIGCGAMSLPSGCPGGCGPERKLELVAGADVDLLLESADRSRQRGEQLAAVLHAFLADSSVVSGAGGCDRGRVALRAHEEALPATVRALSAAPEPVVTWWCERCGGLEAPAPCVGVCIRQPAQWATLASWEDAHAVAARAHEAERQLARAVRTLLLTRPRHGREGQHRRALCTTARQALRRWTAPDAEAMTFAVVAGADVSSRPCATMGGAERTVTLDTAPPRTD